MAEGISRMRLHSYEGLKVLYFRHVMLHVKFSLQQLILAGSLHESAAQPAYNQTAKLEHDETCRSLGLATSILICTEPQPKHTA
jgi:hypothetical protein